VVILTDDMGFSDLGCYGGEVRTPNIDALAAGGVRFTRFYNASRCCPTRASLLTGLYPHQVGLAHNGRDLARDAPTVAELLRAAGYQTAMAGKWHLSETAPLDGRPDGPRHLAWLNHQADHDRTFADVRTYPVGRGFERHYGPIWGVVDYFDPFSLVEGTEPVKKVPDGYYLTDAIAAKAVEYVRAMARDDRPFFLYVAHCAPHWPLHARPEDIARYRETYRDGWHALRAARYRRQVEMGLVDPATHPLPALTGRGPDWDALDAAQRDYEAALMAVHAAMVDRVDQGLGDLVRALKDTGRYDDTVIFILSDNRASPERYTRPGFDRASRTRDGRPIRYAGRFEPGSENTWGYLGPFWASAANTPYRYWKAESFEGGCHTPLVVHWPAGLAAPAARPSAGLGT
jgi:arylsulfatase